MSRTNNQQKQKVQPDVFELFKAREEIHWRRYVDSKAANGGLLTRSSSGPLDAILASSAVIPKKRKHKKRKDKDLDLEFLLKQPQTAGASSASNTKPPTTKALSNKEIKALPEFKEVLRMKRTSYPSMKKKESELSALADFKAALEMGYTPKMIVQNARVIFAQNHE